MGARARRCASATSPERASLHLRLMAGGHDFAAFSSSRFFFSCNFFCILRYFSSSSRCCDARRRSKGACESWSPVTCRMAASFALLCRTCFHSSVCSRRMSAPDSSYSSELGTSCSRLHALSAAFAPAPPPPPPPRSPAPPLFPAAEAEEDQGGGILAASLARAAAAADAAAAVCERGGVGSASAALDSTGLSLRCMASTNPS
mmetsp:Transcript_36108/g.83669  ORF Transcript_36108/g.83669 Transcript_36108/m.83669 type:complete len:203 (+) Transcript_36108:45-653(+)